MEIGWTDVGSGGYILVSCAHSNTSLLLKEWIIFHIKNRNVIELANMICIEEIWFFLNWSKST